MHPIIMDFKAAVSAAWHLDRVPVGDALLHQCWLSQVTHGRNHYLSFWLMVDGKKSTQNHWCHEKHLSPKPIMF